MDIFKRITGKSLDDAFGTPSVEDSIGRILKKSNYPLRSLGSHNGSPFLQSEEERTHTHIIGTTGVGKSALMQLMIREDIDRGNGLCLIDSSDGGDTAYKVLAYCASKNIKPILIDPQHFGRYKYLPINPFGRYPEESAQKILDTIMIQFQQSDFSVTPVIKQYLPAIIRILHKAGCTFSDSIYFTEPIYASQRQDIFDKLSPTDHDVIMVSRCFTDREINREYRPTARRLSDVLNPILRTMFNTRKGIDFRRLITDRRVVICNLYSEGSFGTSHARFLGTTILNEYSRAVDQIRRRGWRGRYYLYVDEAALYANRNVADNLNYKGKTGLQMILAHQYMGQFEDSYVREAILNQTGIKIAFRMPNATERMTISKLMYGGQVKDRDASYYLGQLKKQECVIKLPAQDAVRIRVNDVKEVDLPSGYIETLYQDPIYERKNTVRPESGTQSKRKTAKPTPRRETKHSRPSLESAVGQRFDNSEAAADNAWESLFLQVERRLKESSK